MYISAMKKFSVVFLVLVIFAGLVFANGSPEEQRLFFENLMRNSQVSSSSSVSGRSTTSSTASGSEIISRDMATLERLYQYVNSNFLYDIDYDAVYEAMATALFDALGDKYTYYVVEEESEDYEEEVSGVYGGLGIYFSKTVLDYQDPEDEATLYAYITQVFPGTPAAKMGLKAGDYIIAINGESTVEMEANDCAKLMKGTPGSTVELTIKRNDSTFSITLTRAVITVPTVEYEMIEGSSTAYLRILEFSSSTYSSIKEALTDLIDQGMQKLIIDLRDNPGGDVDVTLSIADLFLKGSKLLSITYKDSSKDITYGASESVLVPEDVEVAILTNGGTASSAEIFTAAMKDNGRATVFGTTTYGKGVMQVISSFGSGYTSITTAGFVGPSGAEIHGVGIDPDYEIEDIYVADEELEAYTKLINDGLVSKYVDEHPDFTEDNVAGFVTAYADSGIRAEVLRLMARNEYLSRLTYDEQPLVDIVYDDVCKAAYEYLQTYELEVTSTESTSTKQPGGRVVNF